MSITSKELKIPQGGLKYELGPELLDELFTPKSLNVHVVNSEVRTKPGVSNFATSDEELKLYLKYDSGEDNSYGLRLGAADNVKLAQSFTTAAVARTANKITLKLKRNGTITAAKVVYLTIEGDSSGPDGTPITNGTSDNVLCTAISGTSAWVTFTFATAMTLAASTKYWIVLQGDYTASGSNYIEWSSDNTSSPYTDGEAYEYHAGWAATGADQDFLFRIYRDAATIMYSDIFFKTTSTDYLMVATLDRLFYWDTGTSDWVDISGYLAANLFTGTIDDPFDYDIYPATDTFFITNYVNPIKKWTGTGLCADLGGSPPRAKYLKVYKDHLLAGYVYDAAADRPQRLMWSDAGDMEVWTGGASGYHDFYEGFDFINGLFLLSDNIVVTKERSIYTGYPVTSTYVFQFDQKIDGIGPVNGRYVMQKGGELLFVAWEDIYAFNGSALDSIADELVRQEFFDTTDPEYILRGFSLDMEEIGEWHIFVSSAGAPYPDTEWVYNYKKKSWWKYSLSVPVTCAGWYMETAGFTIDDIVGTIDQQLWRIGDRSIVGFNYINLLGNTSGRVAKIDYLVGEEYGVGVESYVDTKDFFFLDENGKRIRGKINGIMIKAAGTKCYLYYSVDQGNTYSIIDVSGVTLSPTYAVHTVKFRVTAEQIRFRVYKSAIGENFNLRALAFDVQRGGRL